MKFLATDSLQPWSDPAAAEERRASCADVFTIWDRVADFPAADVEHNVDALCGMLADVLGASHAFWFGTTDVAKNPLIAAQQEWRRVPSSRPANLGPVYFTRFVGLGLEMLAPGCLGPVAAAEFISLSNITITGATVTTSTRTLSPASG